MTTETQGARKKQARYHSYDERHQQFTRWLQRRCSVQLETTGQHVDRVWPIRTSSETVTLWQASARTSVAAADRSDPDVAEALAIGFDLVRRDAIGETRRASLGDAVFPLRMHHAPGGVGARQLGLVLHVGRTFFIYLLSSARAGNLVADTDDRAGNAATEVISTVIRAVWASGRGTEGFRPHLHAREHDRIVRDERHGAALKETLIKCRVIAHTPHPVDLTKHSEAQHFSFGSMLAAGAADAAIRGMNRAEIVIQAEGGFYENIALAPFTHGPTTLLEHDERSGTDVTTHDKHRLAVVPDVQGAKELLRKLVDNILAGGAASRAEAATADWFAVGRVMAEAGLPSRQPRMLSRGVLLNQLPPQSQANAARSLFSERWVSGWRTGAYDKFVPVKIDMELDLTDTARPVENAEGSRGYLCRVSMPLPEGGWGISDAEWDEVLLRRYPAQEKPRRFTGRVMPLGGIPGWVSVASGQQFDLDSKTRRYVLRQRPIADMLLADGSPRSWRHSTATHAATLNSAELHADVGRSMRQALIALEGRPVLPVAIARPRRQLLDPSPAARLEARRAELEKAVALAEARLHGAVDSRNEARGVLTGRSPSPEEAEEVQEAEDAVLRARTALRASKAERSALEEELATGTADQPANRPDEVVDVHTATAEFVAAALEKCPATAPGWLRAACSQLLSEFRLYPETRAGGRPSVRWSATLNLATGDAARSDSIELPLSGRVPDRAHAKGGSAAWTGPEAWAYAFFYRAEGFVEVGAANGVDGSGKKNSYLYKGLHDSLAGAVPDSAMRTADLDCPIPATRRVLWRAVTGDESPVPGLDSGFAKHVMATYGALAQLPKWGWCRDTHTLARRVAALLLESGGTAPLYDLAETLGVPPARITALARVNGKPLGSGTAAHPAPRAVSPFQKNWARSTRWLPPRRATHLPAAMPARRLPGTPAGADCLR